MILALLGATAGQAVVWYCGQFYALFFLTQVLKVDAQPANLLIAAALLAATPFFVVFGILSDRIGRKKIVLLGCLLGGDHLRADLQGSHALTRIRRSRAPRRTHRSASSPIRTPAASSSIRSARRNSSSRAMSPRPRSPRLACPTATRLHRWAAWPRSASAMPRRSPRWRAAPCRARTSRRRRRNSPRR